MTIRDKLSPALSPSTWLKDAFLGGVGVLALRLSYVYLKSFSSRPDLLAKMGPSVILGILAISVVAVLVNRLVDALGTGITRMADSADKAAECAQQTAESQRALAASQNTIAASMQQIANKDDRYQQQQETLLNVLVIQGKRTIRKLHEQDRAFERQDRALERVENILGLNTGPHRKSDEEAGGSDDV